MLRSGLRIGGDAADGVGGGLSSFNNDRACHGEDEAYTKVQWECHLVSRI